MSLSKNQSLTGQAWCWVIIMASIWETLAFLFRAISTKHQQSSGIYLVFQIFILLAPICEYPIPHRKLTAWVSDMSSAKGSTPLPT